MSGLSSSTCPPDAPRGWRMRPIRYASRSKPARAPQSRDRSGRHGYGWTKPACRRRYQTSCSSPSAMKCAWCSPFVRRTPWRHAVSADRIPTGGVHRTHRGGLMAPQSGAALKWKRLRRSEYRGGPVGRFQHGHPRWRTRWTWEGTVVACGLTPMPAAVAGRLGAALSTGFAALRRSISR